MVHGAPYPCRHDPIPGSEPPLGGDGFVVEADETYIGKKDGPKGRKHPRLWRLRP